MQQFGQNKTPYWLVFIAVVLAGFSFSLFSNGRYIWALTPAFVSVILGGILLLQSLNSSRVRGTLSFLTILLAVGSYFLFSYWGYIWAVTPAAVSVILFILSVRNIKPINLHD